MKILMKSLTGMMMRMTVAQRAVVLWMTASAPKTVTQSCLRTRCSSVSVVWTSRSCW